MFTHACFRLVLCNGIITTSNLIISEKSLKFDVNKAAWRKKGIECNRLDQV